MLQSRTRRYPFHYYPSEHDHCFLEIHLVWRPIFLPMAMNIVGRVLEGIQVLPSGSPALLNQAKSFRTLSQILADHFENFVQIEKIRWVRQVMQHVFYALVA